MPTYKLRVTKEELARAIQRVLAFQRNGQFDPEQYQRVLARNRITPEMYEEGTKEELLHELKHVSEMLDKE